MLLLKGLTVIHFLYFFAKFNLKFFNAAGGYYMKFGILGTIKLWMDLKDNKKRLYLW